MPFLGMARREARSCGVILALRPALEGVSKRAQKEQYTKLCEFLQQSADIYAAPGGWPANCGGRTANRVKTAMEAPRAAPNRAEAAAGPAGCGRTLLRPRSRRRTPPAARAAWDGRTDSPGRTGI